MFAIGKKPDVGEVVLLSITSTSQTSTIGLTANSLRHKLNRMGSVAVFAEKV